MYLNSYVWTRKSGELAASSSRDFERLALPLLRIFWPDLIHPRGLSGLDRAGIDLVEWSDTGHFPVVVQCKGLYEEELLVSKQLSQIRKSITSFLNSKFSCETYILLHNRTGEERDAHSTILGYLNDLKTKGKARKVELWDRQKFLKRVKRQLKSVIAARISEGARLKIATQKQFFRYGNIHIDPVPVSIERWRFGATGDIKRDHESPERISPSDMLATTEKYKWTLLIGHFGLGKSTFALHAATTFSNNLIYVHSSELPDLAGGVGTNSLMQKILQSTPLFQDFDDVTASEFERLGSALLRETLSNTQKGFALIVKLHPKVTHHLH
ncbi:MAG: hypothetical protein GY748_19920 [Planctomycetaceae bacterium]|nr:hypothetical protein [Planctomycetaceae bacterium]